MLPFAVVIYFLVTGIYIKQDRYDQICGPFLVPVGLFQYLSTLMLIYAQSGRILGLEKKTDPASSARSDKKGLKDNNNRLLGIVYKICISFGTEIKITICQLICAQSGGVLGED